MRTDWTSLERFQWDDGNLEHITKHQVDAAECEQVFFNRPLVISEDEAHSQTEERFRAYGQTDAGRLLFMIFTVRNNQVRVISARDQSKKERKEFRGTRGEGK
ncbi:MAG: BrnT family toxin [Chloroflexi bacterium]|nr:BrnT family toxin [Chloroflexota bacterium]